MRGSLRCKVAKVASMRTNSTTSFVNVVVHGIVKGYVHETATGHCSGCRSKYVADDCWQVERTCVLWIRPKIDGSLDCCKAGAAMASRTMLPWQGASRLSQQR